MNVKYRKFVSVPPNGGAITLDDVPMGVIQIFGTTVSSIIFEFLDKDGNVIQSGPKSFRGQKIMDLLLQPNIFFGSKIRIINNSTSERSFYIMIVDRYNPF